MRTSIGRRAAVLVILILLLAAGAAGCSLLRDIFGEEQGYLFSGNDVLALPGEDVEVKVRLQSGSLLRDRPGVLLRFEQDGRLLGAARTDDEGYAAIRFTPAAPGDYFLTARAVPGTLKTTPVCCAEVTVSCREALAPLLIVDLDRTLVADGLRRVLVGDPPPMPRSVEVMHELAAGFTVVYLTHRLEYFGPKTKAWLRAHGYPLGPVLLADVHEFLKGSGEYKTEAIENLRKRFRGPLIGIGDKLSDARAYLANRAEAVLLVRLPEDAAPSDLTHLARELESAPPAVQVAADWRDIRKIVVEGAGCPRDAFVENLMQRAKEMETMKKAAEGR